MALQELFFRCVFRRLKRRGELLKFAYLPTFFYDSGPPGDILFDAFFETSFFKCFSILHLKRKSLNYNRFSFFLKISLIFEAPAKNIKNGL